MNDDILRLIQEDIDGALPESDRTRLHAILSADPEAHRLHADLKRIGSAIASMPPVQAPADFTRKVMDRLPVAQAPVRAAIRPAAQSTSRWIDRVFAPANRRVAFAFAIGVFMTIAVVGTLSSPFDIDPNSMSGTMSAATPTTTTVAIDSPSGVIESRITDAGTIISVAFEADATEFSVILEGPTATLDRMLVPISTQGAVTRAEDGLSIDATGSISVLVNPDADGEILVSVRHGDTTVGRTPVAVGRSAK